MDTPETTKESTHRGTTDPSPDDVTAVSYAASETFREAVEESEILLAFTVKAGLDVTNKHLNSLIHAKHALDGNTPLDEAAEASFWHAYQVLASLAKPVSAQTLIETQKYARATVMLFSLYTLITLLVFLILQSYSLHMNTLIREADDVRPQLVETEAEYSKLGLQLLTERSEEKLHAIRAQMKDVEKHIDALNDRLFGHYLLLERYWIVTRLSSDTGDTGSALPVSADSVLGEGRRLFRIEVEWKSFNESLSRYLLPILAGLLGACAFGIQVLLKEIKQHAYSIETAPRLHSRLLLGMLAGFVVAWFIPVQPGAGNLAALTPHALAFLAGYSVEILFSAMDAFVTAFSRTAEPK